jgi:hypothetical protein
MRNNSKKSPTKQQLHQTLDLIQPGSQGWNNPQPNPEVLSLANKDSKQTAKTIQQPSNLRNATKLTTEQVHQRLQIPHQVLRNCQINQALILESDGLILAHVKRNSWIIAEIAPVSVSAS